MVQKNLGFGASEIHQTEWRDDVSSNSARGVISDQAVGQGLLVDKRRTPSDERMKGGLAAARLSAHEQGHHKLLSKVQNKHTAVCFEQSARALGKEGSGSRWGLP